MQTGLDRRAMIPHPYQGRPQDLPKDPEYTVRDDYSNANWRQIAEAIGCVLFTGVMCQEGTVTYGASTTTYCRLTLPDDFSEIGDVLIIGEGGANTRQWRVVVSVENEIEFSDSNLISGNSGITNYNTIKDNLRFLSKALTKNPITTTKDMIARGSFADALHADDLQLASDDVTNLKTKAELIDVEHEADGTHSDDIIDNANLKKDSVLASQGSLNIVRNGAFNINEEGVTDYWEQLGTPPTFKVNSGICGVFPAYSLEIQTDDTGEGARQLLKNVEKGIPLRMMIYAVGDSGGEKIKIMLNDDSSSAELEIDLTDVWTAYNLTFTPSSQCDVYVRAVSNQAAVQTFKIALVHVSFGDVHTYPERSPRDYVLDAVHTMTFYIADLVAAGDEQYAQWILQRGIKIIRIDAYAQIAIATGAATIRLTDDADNVDVVINIAANSGSVESDQEYAAGQTMKLKLLANSATAGSLCTIVVQYRQL